MYVIVLNLYVNGKVEKFITIPRQQIVCNKSCFRSISSADVLIAGGLDRGHSFEELREAMKNVKAVVALGETKHRFIEFAKSCELRLWDIATNIEEAVKKLRNYLKWRRYFIVPCLR